MKIKHTDGGHTAVREISYNDLKEEIGNIISHKLAASAMANPDELRSLTQRWFLFSRTKKAPRRDHCGLVLVTYPSNHTSKNARIRALLSQIEHSDRPHIEPHYLKNSGFNGRSHFNHDYISTIFYHKITSSDACIAVTDQGKVLLHKKSGPQQEARRVRRDGNIIAFPSWSYKTIDEHESYICLNPGKLLSRSQMANFNSPDIFDDIRQAAFYDDINPKLERRLSHSMDLTPKLPSWNSREAQNHFSNIWHHLVIANDHLAYDHNNSAGDLVLHVSHSSDLKHNALITGGPNQRSISLDPQSRAATQRFLCFIEGLYPWKGLAYRPDLSGAPKPLLDEHIKTNYSVKLTVPQPLNAMDKLHNIKALKEKLITLNYPHMDDFKVLVGLKED